MLRSVISVRALLGVSLLSISLVGLSPALVQPAASPASPRGMVVAVSPLGADVGRSILVQGGNAVDAAVATAFAMAVTYPSAGNLGGGGFMVIHPSPGQGKPVVIDYRETAPAAAHKDLFRPGESWYTHRAVATPGTVAGLALAHARYGRLPWKTVIQPAIRLARDGFILDEQLARSLNGIVNGFQVTPELVRVFGKKGGGRVWVEGDRLIQPDLARTLQRIEEQGPVGFYRGPTADLIAAEMLAGGGLITRADLAGYRALVREPIHGRYRGYEVYAPPPPSSGGTCLVLMLHMLEQSDLGKKPRYAPETIHLLAETMRRAYCERARHLGDADFVAIPGHLTSRDFARKLVQSIDPGSATDSVQLAPDIPLSSEGDSTTHFSVIDHEGMAVSNTYTLERSYGSRIVVRGAGFLLNNVMMDFNWYPGKTRRDGQIGTAANCIAPGKRMLSSQTPTIVARDGKVVLVTGSPGGRTIINTVLNILINVLDYGMEVQQAVDAPRMHHQWLPDELSFEGYDEYPDTVRKLQQLGHQVRARGQGDAHTIYVDPRKGTYNGAADRRINGKVSGF